MTSDLTQMFISNLCDNYVAWSQRHEAPLALGPEPLDFDYEVHVIRKPQRRTPANLDEQLKIDYRFLSCHNELRNLSYILSLPLEALQNEKCALSSE